MDIYDDVKCGTIQTEYSDIGFYERERALLLAPLQECPKVAVPCCPPCKPACNKQATKENKMQNMHIEVAAAVQQPLYTEADSQRRFLLGRLEDAYYTSRDAQRKTFNLDDMDAPKTPKELAARLAAGLFVVKYLDKEPEKSFGYHLAGEYIQWRDPSKPADQAGYDAVKWLLKAARDDAELAIKCQSVADGLAALKAFKATSAQ